MEPLKSGVKLKLGASTRSYQAAGAETGAEPRGGVGGWGLVWFGGVLGVGWGQREGGSFSARSEGWGRAHVKRAGREADQGQWKSASSKRVGLLQESKAKNSTRGL